MTDLGVTTRKSSSKGHLTTSNTNDEVNHYFMTAIIKGIKERHGVKDLVWDRVVGKGAWKEGPG